MLSGRRIQVYRAVSGQLSGLKGGWDGMGTEHTLSRRPVHLG